MLQTDLSQWKVFFYVAIGMYIMSNIVFVTFGSGELQEWDSSGANKSSQLGSVEERRRKMSKKLSVAMANF